MRNWTPFLHEAIDQMRADGGRRSLGIVMAPHRCYASWEQYQENVAEALDRAGRDAPAIEYVDTWFNSTGFIEAQADRVAEVIAGLPEDLLAETPLVFTAHSIPRRMDQESGYAEQVRESARLVADRLGYAWWSVAYQSRSGDPREPWLEPDINAVIADLGQSGAAAVVTVPVGFVSDHIEVLYDLDIEARETARRAGIGFYRAATVMDHPVFIRMLGDLVAERISYEP